MTPAMRSAAKKFAFSFAATWLTVAAWATAAAQSPPKNFILHEASKPIVAVQFDDEQGRSRSLADFSGKVVLLNIWATWCVPCRKEMPTLDRLQATLGGPDFEVVALSIDRGGTDVVRKFFAETGVQKLAMYVDKSGREMRDLGVVGLPTTLLVDRKGQEVGRLIGPAEWDAPEVVEFIKCVVARKDAAQSPAESKAPTVPPCSTKRP